MENILEQSAEKALEFFLDSDSYVDFDLPAYFQFGKMLEKIQERVGDRPYEECCQSSPADCEKVNLEMLTNKDGHFAVRPLSIVNPYLYYLDEIENLIEEALMDVPEIDFDSLPDVFQ